MAGLPATPCRQPRRPHPADATPVGESAVTPGRAAQPAPSIVRRLPVPGDGRLPTTPAAPPSPPPGIVGSVPSLCDGRLPNVRSGRQSHPACAATTSLSRSPFRRSRLHGGYESRHRRSPFALAHGRLPTTPGRAAQPAAGNVGVCLRPCGHSPMWLLTPSREWRTPESRVAAARPASRREYRRHLGGGLAWSPHHGAPVVPQHDVALQDSHVVSPRVHASGHLPEPGEALEASIDGAESVGTRHRRTGRRRERRCGRRLRRSATRAAWPRCCGRPIAPASEAISVRDICQHLAHEGMPTTGPSPRLDCLQAGVPGGSAVVDRRG